MSGLRCTVCTAVADIIAKTCQAEGFSSLTNVGGIRCDGSSPEENPVPYWEITRGPRFDLPDLTTPEGRQGWSNPTKIIITRSIMTSRPTSLSPEGVVGFALDGGLKLRKSAFWTIFISRCRNVVVRDISIENEMLTLNTDGIDPSSSAFVLI